MNHWIVAIAIVAVVSFVLTGGIARWLGMFAVRDAETQTWGGEGTSPVDTVDGGEVSNPLYDNEILFVRGEQTPPPVRVHVQCLDSWADGKRPCGRCSDILEVRA